MTANAAVVSGIFWSRGSSKRDGRVAAFCWGAESPSFLEQPVSGAVRRERARQVVRRLELRAIVIREAF
jgi:hypothetical protein